MGVLRAQADYESMYPTDQAVAEDSQSLIQPDRPPALITNIPGRRQEAIDTGGGYIDPDTQEPISYMGGDTAGHEPPALGRPEDQPQSAIDKLTDTRGTADTDALNLINFGKKSPADLDRERQQNIDKMLKKGMKLTPEELTKVSEGIYRVSLTIPAKEQAQAMMDKDAVGNFRQMFNYNIKDATDADLARFREAQKKNLKTFEDNFTQRQKLALAYYKEHTPDALKALQMENVQLGILKKKVDLAKPEKPEKVTPRNANYMTPAGKIVIVNMNDPNAQSIIDTNGLKPYKEPAKPEKPEYKPGQAMKRMSAISSAISRLKSGSPIDALLVAQIPEYAGLMASNDPAAKQQAIDQLTTELEYVKGFAPATTKETPPAAPVDTERQNADAAIKAGVNPAKVKEMYKKRTGKDY